MPITINGTGTLTGVSVGGLPDGIVDTDMLAANAVSSAKLASGAGGKLLQVVQDSKTDTASQSVDSGGVWNLSDPIASITPSSASNKILVQATVMVGINVDSHGPAMTVLKDDALMFAGNADGNMQRTTVQTFHHTQYRACFLHFNYLDTAGGTSAIQYKIRLSHDSGANQTMYLNRTVATDNLDDRHRGASNIILMEIAA